MMIVIDARTSYKHGAYLPDKSDATTIVTFDAFHTTVKTTTGKKICRIRIDQAYELTAWGEYCQCHGITHEFTAPYLSVQNGLAERAIRTTIDDVHILLSNSKPSHSYWAEAGAYLIATQNIIPSCQHPDCIPAESLSGKRQNVAHLHVFGSKCWAKIPAAMGTSKPDPCSTKC